ncbi:MAG: ATP-binding cassette domain-containing protein [Chloroflexi bacterium]|nr:ATP-binding cassette domain-containing protein [Chloroflexota bacterium]
MSDPILITKDLRKSYGSLEAVKGISFSVLRGEIFSLLGPNGAGKTTILSMLSCLLEPSGERPLSTITPSPRKQPGAADHRHCAPRDRPVRRVKARQKTSLFGAKCTTWAANHSKRVSTKCWSRLISATAPTTK